MSFLLALSVNLKRERYLREIQISAVREIKSAQRQKEGRFSQELNRRNMRKCSNLINLKGSELCLGETDLGRQDLVLNFPFLSLHLTPLSVHPLSSPLLPFFSLQATTHNLISTCMLASSPPEQSFLHTGSILFSSHSLTLQDL